MVHLLEEDMETVLETAGKGGSFVVAGMCDTHRAASGCREGGSGLSFFGLDPSPYPDKDLSLHAAVANTLLSSVEETIMRLPSYARGAFTILPSAEAEAQWHTEGTKRQAAVCKFNGRLEGDYCLSDGSPSTEGVPGRYHGQWMSSGSSRDSPSGRPTGKGTMAWDNGITYSGHWDEAGRYHGHGSKTYSRGGGYEGQWQHGKRHGWGVSFYGGKWGYDRWEGPFVDDMPHGQGTMY
jgi:hypothetical protein